MHGWEKNKLPYRFLILFVHLTNHQSKVQQAKVSKSINYSNEFNEILEESSDISAEKSFTKL